MTDKTNPFISMKKLSAVLDSFLILKNRRVKKTAWFLYQTVFVSEGEENFVGDSEIIALGGASNETKDRPLG
ncbi:hypothetical protein KGMB02707_03570 [Mesosutterella multiformis]|nr:hypothetical protein KGMB02707_03570 [Mesosutterella multiformis]